MRSSRKSLTEELEQSIPILWACAGGICAMRNGINELPKLHHLALVVGIMQAKRTE